MFTPIPVNSGQPANTTEVFPPKVAGNVPLPVERVPGTDYAISRWRPDAGEIKRLLEGHDLFVIVVVPRGQQHPSITLAAGVIPVSGVRDSDGFITGVVVDKNPTPRTSVDLTIDITPG